MSLLKATMADISQGYCSVVQSNSHACSASDQKIKPFLEFENEVSE